MFTHVFYKHERISFLFASNDDVLDVDSNGYLDERDFACLALRAAIVEGKGEFSFSRLQEHQHIMLSLWEEMAELADFNKVVACDEFIAIILVKRNNLRPPKDLLQDGKITVDEFKQAVQQCCLGKRYDDLPQAMKMFIDSSFKMVDMNDDGIIDADEYRYSCVTKFPIDEIEVVDEAFDNLLSVRACLLYLEKSFVLTMPRACVCGKHTFGLDDDRRRGGLTLSRYQELYAQFLGNPDEECSAGYLFGPLSEIPLNYV
ncbi:hypothetical protein FQR65_LT14938 [Abscondita terminalis]|nr:hypothetical protein FQR65_LT14938 [Abscondita terminalis]